jgi:pimeloyl-ACP methyl ester carboxylesterase
MTRRIARPSLAGLGVALAAALGLALAGAGAARAAPDHYRAYVDGPWGQIHVRVDGPAGGPTVILLHKMVWSSLEFEKAQPELAKLGVRSIAVDLPGYGLSDEPPFEPSAEQYADAMVAVLDHFHLKKADFLGTDTGASISVAFDDRHPERVGKLILEGPPLFPAEKLVELLKEPVIDRSGSTTGAELAQRVASLPPHSMSPEAMQLGAIQFFVAGPHYLYGHHAAFKFALADGLKKVTAPTLLLDFAGKDGFHEISARTVRPDFQYVRLDWPSLMADFDNPKPWAAAVAKFVKAP